MRQTLVTSPTTSTNKNMTTSTNFPSLTGTYTGTVDAYTLVSNTQAVFDKFYKAIWDPDLATEFEKMVKIWDLN